MAGIARFALVPLALAAAAVPAAAQADAHAAQLGRLLGSVGGTRLYPFAGTELDPLSNSLDATVAGAPVKSMGLTQVFSDGLPVRDLPGFAEVTDADTRAEAAGNAMLAQDGDQDVSSALGR
jgi:outer membrane protein W